MKNFSLTYIGAFVSIIMALGALFDVDLDQGRVTEVVNAAGVIVGLVVTLYGRWRSGDIHWTGLKNK